MLCFRPSAASSSAQPSTGPTTRGRDYPPDFDSCPSRPRGDGGSPHLHRRQGSGLQRIRSCRDARSRNAQGVDPDRITLEEEATSTWENLVYARPLVSDCSSIVGISDRYHLARIQYLAELQDWGSYPCIRRIILRMMRLRSEVSCGKLQRCCITCSSQSLLDLFSTIDIIAREELLPQQYNKNTFSIQSLEVLT